MIDGEKIRQLEHEHKIFSYNRIDESIFAGNNMCCQIHFSKELLSKGVSADISLEAERLDNPTGVSFFFWFPWVEDTAPTIEYMMVALDTINLLIKRNVKLYIHCKNGHGRTSILLASYFIREKKMTAEQALKLVKEKRPSMHINDEQKNFLKTFEKECQKKSN